MKKVITLVSFIILFTSIFGLGSSIASTLVSKGDKNEYFENNSDKNFKSANEFYLSLKENQYKEFKNADLNIRQKVSYKDLKSAIDKLGKYGSETMYSSNAPHIDPNRQVYFLATVIDNDKMFESKYVVYDGETKNILNSGRSGSVKDKKNSDVGIKEPPTDLDELQNH
ncbi:MAG: hypothetical protein ABF649_06735 [Bacillus sp. (in: firmicutes)]